MLLSLILIAAIDSNSPKHLAAGMVGGYVTYQYTESVWQTVGLSVVAGFAHEMYQEANGGVYDTDDIMFDVFGAWIGAQGAHARVHRGGITFTWRF